MDSRGTTLIGREQRSTLRPTPERLASHLTLGERHRLVRRTCSPVPLGSSGGNFDQFPPGGGFSLCPRLPVDFRWLTFLRQGFFRWVVVPIICKTGALSRVIYLLTQILEHGFSRLAGRQQHASSGYVDPE